MAITTPSIDYTDKDFESLRLRLRNLIRSAFPTWTDENVSNFGNLLVELFAHIGDVLGYYQDNQAKESRWTQATQRKNMIGLTKLIGYKVPGATAAQALCTLSLPSIPTADVAIPAGSIVRTESATSPITFQVLADAIIHAGANPPAVSALVENSTTKVESFASTGKPNQRLQLTQSPYVDGSLAIVAADGAYTQVDNFLDSAANARNFVVLVDQSDRATVLFGNGVNGSVPSGTISTTYKIGGGIAGRVEAGAIRRIDGNFTDALGRPVVVLVTNPDRTSGGNDRQSVAQIRQLAPASLRATTRTVAREDYELHAKEVAGVARALMLTADDDAGITENHGQLFLVPTDGGLPTQALKDAVKTYVTVTKPNSLSFQLAVLDPIYLTVNVYAVLWFTSETPAVKAAAKTRILAGLQTFFAITNADGTPNTNVDFGFYVKDPDGLPAGSIALSDVQNVVRDTVGVLRMGTNVGDFLLNGAHADVPILLRQFPKLGTVTVVDARTGLPV